MKKYCYILLLAFALVSCLEPYEPEVGEYDSTLVVDGLFSNSVSPSTVRLSRSFPYSEEEGAPIQGAVVIIEEEQGGQSRLLETSPGVYQTDTASFRGQIGRSYRLLVRTPDGDHFESDWEEMKAAPPIDELYSVYQERIPDDPTSAPIAGMQFFLSTQDPEQNTRYYRWEYEETYQFGLRHPAWIRVEFGSSPGNGEDEIFLVSADEYEGGSCWKTERSTQLLIATTEDFTQDIIDDLPLLYVDNTTSRLYLRYSLLVKQYAVSKPYYTFLRKIQEINQTTGSLFDPIPNEVFGNINNADGKDIPVLGYFAVAGVSERRIFVNRDELPRGFGAPFGPQCINDTINLDFRTLYNRMRLGGAFLYGYHVNEMGTPIGYLLTGVQCSRCAASQATNKKPDFW